ncbi:hypothetical protein ACJIZ3_023978 [Penstemon smallii]|uniref:DUF8040 domain-containing protein n=1 Tax=Penstemon smallii TaxID=265156 RepID=A0ABD3TQK5_9LAMI
MHEAELHDLSDDSDYAASVKQGSASMMILSDSSSRRSSMSESEGAELVYNKDNVTIHPTQYAYDGIVGRLKLIKQGDSLFLTWIPYKGQNSNAKVSEKVKNLYTIRAVPFSDIHSIRRHTPRLIRRHTPTLGWQYIIVVLSSGLAFPPLYFYNGGVREFLTTIKQHVFLVRSPEDDNVFLVNDFRKPLQYAEYISSITKGKNVTCRNNVRLIMNAFEKLCCLLHNAGGLRDTKYVPVREQVAMFLSVLAHHKKIRIIGIYYKRSGDTVSKCFYRVLNSLLTLHPILLSKPKPIGLDCADTRWNYRERVQFPRMS